MSVLWRSVRSVSRLLHPALPNLTNNNVPKALVRASPLILAKRLESNYDPYPEIKTPSPYKKRDPSAKSYEFKYYTGGLLPRPQGKWEDIPVPQPIVDPKKRDAWTPTKALFGQNDYIDILGDGTVHPAQLYKTPPWLRGFKGNELERLSRQLKYQGEYLKDLFPSEYHRIKKQMFFLYKRLNRRRSHTFPGGARRYSRIMKPSR